MPPEGGRPLPPRFPLEQHYVHPGEGRPLPSKDARKDPRHRKKVPVTIEEPPVSPKIARPEPASTSFRSGLRLSLLGEQRPLLPYPSRGTYHEARQHSLRPFPPGLGNSPPGKGQLLPPQDAYSDPETGLREPIALGRTKSSSIVRVQPASSANPLPGPEGFPLEEGRLLSLGLSLGRHHVHLEEGRPACVSGNAQQEPGEPATVKESSGMCSGSPACSLRRTLPPLGTFSSGRRAATTARFVHGTAAHASWKTTADAVELPSRSSTFFTRKGAAVPAKSAFEGRTVVAPNGTGRGFADKYGASGCWIGGRKTGKHRAKLDEDSCMSR